MTAIPKRNTDNVINLSVIDGKLGKKKEVKYNKDGTVNKSHSNRTTGVSSEVYAFTTKEEITSMINLFNKRIKEAPDDNKMQIACRNKMLFVVGINIGLRASELVCLKWNFFLNDDMTFKQDYKIKTKKTKKYVPLYFNDAVKKAITEYIEEYPIENMDDYLFKSRKGNGSINEKTLWYIVSEAAIEVGIEQNIGSHSLRKTFGFWAWHRAKDKNKALVLLQMIFNHNSTATTAKYIGITNDEISDVFNSLDLGLDDI